MKRLALIGFVLLLSQWAMAQTVTFSATGGFYDEPFELSLHCNDDFQIRYTTNGGEPTATSHLYQGNLLLDERLYSESKAYTIVNTIPSLFRPVDDVEHAIVIRAAAFDANGTRVSQVVTQTYMIRSLGCNSHGLPVISIAADSLALFDYETGIFVPGVHYDASDSTHTGNFHQTGRDWERQVNFEFYEADNSCVNQLCGLRTHGGASRFFQQKGMKLYAREEYGKKRFKHQFFSSTMVSSFKHLCLHPFRCSNWLQTGGQDYLAHRVASQLNMESLAVREVVVFVNGEYWGIYTLEESPDERYLEDHHDVDLNQVNVIKWWVVEQYGDITEWRDFYNWMRYEADMQNPVDSTRAFTQLDMESFVDYLLFGTFSANLDWPQNNVMLWQPANGEPFRFILFDGDGCFTRVHYQAMNNAINQGGNSVILRRLLTCNHFRQMLKDRFLALKETHFSYAATKPYLEEYRAAVSGEIANQAQRFGFPWNQWKWQFEMDSTNQFLQRRCSIFEQELADFLLVDENSGSVMVACYPNPSSGQFSLLLFCEKEGMMPLEVVDVRGQKVYHEMKKVEAGENVLRLDLQLASGLYLLRLGDVTQRIIIE